MARMTARELTQVSTRESGDKYSELVFSVCKGRVPTLDDSLAYAFVYARPVRVVVGLRNAFGEHKSNQIEQLPTETQYL
jgi:hypothetical protein